MAAIVIIYTLNLDSEISPPKLKKKIKPEEGLHTLGNWGKGTVSNCKGARGPSHS